MSSTAASVSLAEMLDSASTEPRASVRERIDRCLHMLPADQRLAHVLEAITTCQMRQAQTVEFVAEAWAYLQEHELWRVDSERRFASLENLRAHLDTQVNLSHMLESHAKLSWRRRTALDAIAAEWGRNLSDVLPSLLPPCLSDKLLRGLSRLSRLVGGHEATELLQVAVGARLQRPHHRKDECLTVDDVTRVLNQLSSRLTLQGPGPAPAAKRAHSTPAYVLRVGHFGTVGTPVRTRASARLLERTTKDAGVVTNPHKLATPTGREDNDEGGGEDDEDCEDDDDDDDDEAAESGEQGGDGEHSQDEVEDTDGNEYEEAFRANVRRTHRARLLRCGCAPICASLISRIPHGGPRLGDEKGADLLKRSHGLGWENICHNHIRRLAGALSMYTNHSRYELIKRLKLVFHYRTNLREPRNKKSRYFRLAGRETRSRLGLYRYTARRTDTFSFDAKRVFNRFAGSPSAWDTFQHDGTINVDGVFEYLFTPEILALIEEEFRMYLYHLGSEQDGQKRRGWMRHMFYSLIQQLVRQDPVYYAMTAAARPDQNSWLISYPYYVKYQIAGESSGFAHFDISVDEFVKTGRGKNIVQGSLSLDDETENGCTLLVPGFHRHIHEWWARVKRRGRDTSGYTTNAKKTYSPVDQHDFGKLTPVPCQHGAIRITKPDILHGSTSSAECVRRTLFNWYTGIREDHHTLDMPESESWDHVAQCHQSMEAPMKSTSGEGFRYGRPTKPFPGVTRLSSTSYVGDALVGARRWDDVRVQEERDILLGDNDDAAFRQVKAIRERMVRAYLDSIPYVRKNEERAYGPKSYFRNKGRDRPPADNDTSSLSSEVLSLDDESIGDV